MPLAQLRLEQAPPISVPFRFFLTAPVFLLLAALLLLWRGPEVWQSRFAPPTIALTHLFSIGFMSMVMIGAVQQMLPVLAGAPIKWPRATAGITHAGLTVGTLSLAAGILGGEPVLMGIAAAALAIGFGVFLLAVATSLALARARSWTVGAIWLALLSLLVAVLLGLTLLSSRAWGTSLPGGWILDLHPAWGLLGWTGLLVGGIAFQVVPMLQTTPPYPAFVVRSMAAGAFALLAAWSLIDWLAPPAGGAVRLAGTAALALVYVVFAAVTIVLLRRRRRRLPDPSVDFWKIGMICLIAASAGWWLQRFAPAAFGNAIELCIGVLVFAGFAGSVINGMLYKIVPFLAWFHAQARAADVRSVPNVREMLGQADQRRQFAFHLIALGLLLCSTAWPTLLVYPAALFLGASAVLLEANLLKVARAYRAVPAREPEAARQPEAVIGSPN